MEVRIKKLRREDYTKRAFWPWVALTVTLGFTYLAACSYGTPTPAAASREVTEMLASQFKSEHPLSPTPAITVKLYRNGRNFYGGTALIEDGPTHVKSRLEVEYDPNKKSYQPKLSHAKTVH